jgi:ASC-1-like (ASCH) protein
MQTHTIHLHPKPYAAVSGGSKAIELRLYDDKRRQIKLGDELLFVSRQDEAQTTRTRVTGLLFYQSFADLFAHTDAAAFGGSDAVSLLHEIRQFYSAADEQVSGVIGIVFERV